MRFPYASCTEREITRAQMLKWGNSLAVRIPKHIADEANLKAGDPGSAR
jgi:hypothetical protein